MKKRMGSEDPWSRLCTITAKWRSFLLLSPALGAMRTSLVEVGMPGCMWIAAAVTAEIWPCQLLLHSGTLLAPSQPTRSASDLENPIL